MLPLGDYGQQLCPSCPRQPHRIDRTLVLGDYRGVLRETILRMKRAHHEALTFAVGGLLAERVEETGFADDIDLIVPLPSHWRRRFRRWFNIAELLACPVARRSRLALAKNLLKYQRLPDKQGTLTRLQRFVNMRAAMSAKRGYFLSGRAVLLVDDVTTSGATAREAARVCRQAGAGRVKLAVVARGKDA